MRDLPGEAPDVIPSRPGGAGPGAGEAAPGADPQGPVRPVRHLGLFRLIGVGINGVIGGGIFILPATVAALLGWHSIVAYLLAAMVVLGIGTVLGRLASRFETSGGPYAYVEQAFGPLAGFQIGWLFWLARTTAMANLMNGAALYLGALWPILAGPWWRAAVITLCAGLVIGINIAGIRQTAMATNLFAVLKVVPLLIVALTAFIVFETPHYFEAPALNLYFLFVHYDPHDILRAVLLLIYAFTGFETLTVPAEESLRPRRDMPRALLATVVIVSGIYLLVHAAAEGAIGVGLGQEKAPLATVAGMEFGPEGRLAMTAAAALSMAGCSMASLLGGTRTLYAMSASARIPRWIGALHPGNRTPVRAAFLTGGIATILAIAGGFAFLAAVSAGTRLLMYGACCLAGFKARTGWIVPGLTTAAIAVLLFGLEPKEVLFGMIGIGFGWALSILAGSGRREWAREES